MEKQKTQVSVNTPTEITDLIFCSNVFLMKYMGVNGVWILQKGVYEGRQNCQRDLHVWYMLHFASTRIK